MKRFVLTLLLVLSPALILCCAEPRSEWIPLASGDIRLVVVFVEDADRHAINRFLEEHIDAPPDPARKGTPHRPGVGGIMATKIDERDAYVVGLRTGVLEAEEIEAMVAEFESSEIVYEVLVEE